MGDLDEPGEHRFEVVDGDRVELLFGVFVGKEAPVLIFSPRTPPRGRPAHGGGLPLRLRQRAPPRQRSRPAGAVRHLRAARGHYYENLSVADTTAEAWEALLASLGHLANVLCKECTHLSIGAATAPSPERRIYVVWEAMVFPQGAPLPIG